MKSANLCVVLFMVMTSILSAEKVEFDKKYSVEFPEGWKKSENPRKDALVYREADAGDASFAIAKLALPKNAKADLKGTLQSMIEGFKKGMEVLEIPEITKGGIDGKEAHFARVFVKTGGHKLGFFLVAVDAKDRVYIMQATLPSQASDKARADCMKVIQSFKENKPKP